MVENSAEEMIPLVHPLSVCCLQAVYMSHDTDRSGTINSSELTMAFKSAGEERRCSVSGEVWTQCDVAD